MFCTVIVRSVNAATALIGLVGITWAMTLWAPYAIISAEISRRDATIRARKLKKLDIGSNADTATSSAIAAQTGRGGGSSDDSEEDEEVDQAGVILGIHNMAIAAPQIIATLGSSIIFKSLQKPRGTPGDHSYSVVLALGGACVFVSSFFVAKIRDNASMPADGIFDAEQGQAGHGDATRPGLRRGRSSYEALPRASVGRATLTRNKSFSGADRL
jgi:solute carrier family 45 protein 1/2/4